MEYFNLEPKVRRDTAFAIPTGNANTPSGARFAEQLRGETALPYQLALMDLRKYQGHWIPVDDLSKIGQLWLDYQPNEWAFPMMSAKMADIVKQYLTGSENVDWISASISGPNEIREYFIPRFSKLFDYWDKERTVYGKTDGLIVNPCYKKELVANLALFYCRPQFWEITAALVVNEPLMKAIKKAKITGVGFTLARSV